MRCESSAAPMSSTALAAILPRLAHDLVAIHRQQVECENASHRVTPAPRLQNRLDTVRAGVAVHLTVEDRLGDGLARHGATRVPRG